MSAPGAPHGTRQQEESGGQPLVYGSIPDGTVLYRNNYQIVGSGSGASIPTIRVDAIEIKNQTTGLYTRYKCRDTEQGDSELYIDAEDLP